MSVSQQDFSQLQQRITLLEGGNTPFQVELTNQIKELKQLMISGATITASSAEVQALNKKFDTLLDYLENWIGVGNVNMNDIKEEVN